MAGLAKCMDRSAESYCLKCCKIDAPLTTHRPLVDGAVFQCGFDFEVSETILLPSSNPLIRREDVCLQPTLFLEQLKNTKLSVEF